MNGATLTAHVRRLIFASQLTQPSIIIIMVTFIKVMRRAQIGLRTYSNLIRDLHGRYFFKIWPIWPLSGQCSS